ncbi:hypothetical protein V9L05_04375 [Bernardetia sp. Wsw4-3y2]|uniref:hypothetical protein n=1 Tax=Bernardetia sp. Wsw4-3y2 TaxID=3127471 RepID=UPI0030CAEECE
MKSIIVVLLSFFMFSCSSKNKQIISRLDKIEKIEVYQSSTKIEMQDDFKEKFMVEVKKAKKAKVVKFMKTHQFLIYKTDNTIDTLYTNGKAYQMQGDWFKGKYFITKENLIDKYKK